MTDNTGAGSNSPGAGTGSSPAGSATPAGPPEGLDPKFWNGDTNSVDAEGLTAAYRELADAKSAREAGVPAHASGYKIELPADFKLPEGLEVKFDPNDSRIGIGREFARELGLDQTGFSKLLALDTKLALAQAQAVRAEMAAEAAKLGEKFPARKAAVESFLTANVGEDGLKALMPQVRSAAAFEALEKLIAKATATGVPGSTGSDSFQPKPADVPMAERWYGDSKNKAK